MNSTLVVALAKFIAGTGVRWIGCAPGPEQRIYFANHTSNLDALIVWTSLPGPLRERTRPVAAQDYWTADKLRHSIATKIFNAVLIERKKVTVSNNPLDLLLAALDEKFSLTAGDRTGTGLHRQRQSHPAEGRSPAGAALEQRQFRRAAAGERRRGEARVSRTGACSREPVATHLIYRKAMRIHSTAKNTKSTKTSSCLVFSALQSIQIFSSCEDFVVLVLVLVLVFGSEWWRDVNCPVAQYSHTPSLHHSVRFSRTRTIWLRLRRAALFAVNQKNSPRTAS
jgi:hypothetical protein